MTRTGDPIPAPDGSIIERTLYSLLDIPLHTPARVARLVPQNGEMLRYILEQGLTLQNTLHVIQRAPFEGPLTLHLDGGTVVIGYKVASAILVEVAAS
ncbi:ferrous iron transport protein A [bacterium]|nr:ferrous iron transport protein A [bacterium]